jgi:asparagine synthase (glutamine-hydrolysing)
MAEALRHRGPDDGGEWVDAEAGVALGHRRLAVVDLSPNGRQPMHSPCGRYVIVFNGEIYNFRALREELAAGPGTVPAFRSHSDTEVMLAAIGRWGLERALQRFNGMFAFALWDREARRLHLVRDRLGEKPLYYGWAGTTFLFGSELKALRAHPDFRGDVDRDAVALFLRHGYIPGPYSIYTGIFKLPPATVLTLDASAMRATPTPVAYWSARAVAEHGVANPFEGPVEEATARLDALLRDAVKLRMEADVPLGAFLSGGVDSSTVVALMQSQSNRPVKTFTVGFAETGYDEAEDARAVAAHLGTDHTALRMTPEEASAVIPRLPRLYDEPFADPSQIPTCLVSELARRHVTVSLSGDGGDELFAGYNRYFWGRGVWKALEWMPATVSGVAARAFTSLSPERWEAVFRGLGPLLPDRMRQPQTGAKLHQLAEVLAVHRTEAMYLELISHWKDPASLVPGASEPPTVVTDRSCWPALPDIVQRMMYLDMVSYLPDDILVKVDRAAMGFSLEGRVPLLDHRVVEFAWQIPLSLKVRNGGGKWLLRQVLRRYVPEDLVDRPKMGFGVPIGEWLRGPLREWAETLLDERRLRQGGLLDPRPIREKWTEHLSGSRNWQHHLWDVLMLVAWLDEGGGRAGDHGSAQIL